MDRKNNVMVLCDGEREYAELFGEYLRKQKDLPWKLRVYTDASELMQRENGEDVAMLVASESTYCEELGGLQCLCTVILNESGLMTWEKHRNVDKYQRADNVVRELLEIYLEIAAIQLPKLKMDFRTTFIGMYSPVRRCLQTSFALTMSQLLAREHSTLYLNFEHYVGVTELLPDRQTRDLSDLLYFLMADKEKFQLRLRTMLQHKGALDYIPPMKSGQNLLSVTEQEWMNLLQKIGELGQYEYVVLDLSESMQGLFEILRLCKRVFTLSHEDKISQVKLMQYEQLLTAYEYDDVLQKTRKCSVPDIKRLPEDLEQYTKGELAGYVMGEIRNLCM